MGKTSKLSWWQLLRLLRKHSKLSEQRNVALAQNRMAKVFGYIAMVFTVMYLMFLSVMLALIANSSTHYTASELMFGMMPFILAVDFFFRFAIQQTPSQLIKPYVMLPIGKNTCIDCFLFNSVTSLGNLVWMALFLPYAIMSILFVEGFWAAIGFLLAAHLLIVIDSQWYMLIRTLVNRKYYWWLLAAVVYALMFSPCYLGKDSGFVKLCKTYAVVGDGAAHWSLLVFGGILLLLCLLLLINRKVQYISVYDELSKNEKTEIKHVTQLQQLNKLGETGEYVKLEIKSIMRNKNIRKGFISANIVIIMFSLLIAFTDVYSGGFTKFLAVYNFAIYGAIILVKTMCYEGNYIDCLMVHKENIYSLLKAKYWIYTALLIIPLILMIPTVVMGKCSLLMLIAVMILTAGPVHASFLYISIFNKQTMPLNTKFIGKGSIEANYFQVIAEIAAFILPLLVLNIMPILFGETWGAVVIIVLGLIFVFTHPIWIRDIYQRIMRRRYENLESFHASR